MFVFYLFDRPRPWLGFGGSFTEAAAHKEPTKLLAKDVSFSSYDQLRVWERS